MDFCSSCGILLSLDLVGQSLCRPCASAHQHRTSGISDVCQCAFCGKSSLQSPRSHKTTTNVYPPSPLPARNVDESRKGRKKSKPGNLKQKNTSHDQDHVLNSSHSSADNGFDDISWASKSLQESSHLYEDWDRAPSLDWGTQDNCWVDTPEKQLSKFENFFVDTREQQTSDWTVVGNRKPHTMFGDHDFPDIGECKGNVMNVVKAEWEREQEELKQKLDTRDTRDIARLVSGQRRKHDGQRFHVGGVDISFIKDNNIDACASLSVVRMPDLELVYQRMEMIQLTQPYIPGFLAFREVPPLSDLFAKLKEEAPQYTPDVIMVDGNGVLHPKGFGLASHLGVTLDIPTIGVAKTLMSAQGIVDDDAHKAKKPSLSAAGDGFNLIADSGQVLGKCVRVHDSAPNPIYVSVGHKISLKSAVWLVLECSKYRIPEPVRRADLDSRDYIRRGRSGPYLYKR